MKVVAKHPSHRVAG